jgi:hypothetical protein
MQLRVYRAVAFRFGKADSALSGWARRPGNDHVEAIRVISIVGRKDRSRRPQQAIMGQIIPDYLIQW